MVMRAISRCAGGILGSRRLNPRENILPITDDVLELGVALRLNVSDVANFSFTTIHHFHLFAAPDFWRKLITRDFDIAAEVLQRFADYCSPQSFYKTLKRLRENKNLPASIKLFYAYPDNHVKLLACLTNHEDVLSLLPASEDAIWLHVALAMDCSMVYQSIYKRNPERMNRLQLALRTGNAAAMHWVRASLSVPEESRLVKETCWDGRTDYKYLNSANAIGAGWMTYAVQAGNLDLFLALKEELVLKDSRQYSLPSDPYYLTKMFDPLKLYLEALASGSPACARWLKDYLDKSSESPADEMDVVCHALASRCEETWRFVFGHSGIRDEEGKLNTRLQKLIAYILKERSEFENDFWAKNYIKAVIESGHLELMRLVLMQLESKDGGNLCELLMTAAEAGNIEAIKSLVGMSPEPFSCSYQFLVQYAARRGEYAMVQYLVSTYFPTYFSELVEDDYPVDLSAPGLLREVMESGNIEFAQYVIDNIAAHTPNGESIVSEFFAERATIEPEADSSDEDDSDERFFRDYYGSPDAFSFFDEGADIATYMIRTVMQLRSQNAKILSIPAPAIAPN